MKKLKNIELETKRTKTIVYEIAFGITLSASSLLLSADIMGLITLEKWYYAFLPVAILILIKLSSVFFVSVLALLISAPVILYKMLYGKK